MRSHQLSRRLRKDDDCRVTDLGVDTTVVNFKQSVLLNCVCFGDAPSLLEGCVGTSNEAQVPIVSDADEQMIFKFIFKDPVNITAVAFKREKISNADSADEEAPPMSGPKTVKLYAGREELDFSEVSEIRCAQEIILTQKDLDDFAITPLSGSKFQNIRSLQIFVQDNQEDTEKTVLHRVQLQGLVLPPYTSQYEKKI